MSDDTPATTGALAVTAQAVTAMKPHVPADPDTPYIREPYQGYSPILAAPGTFGSGMIWDERQRAGDMVERVSYLGDRYHGAVYDPNGKATTEENPGLPADPYGARGYISKTPYDRNGYYTSFDVVTRDNTLMVVKDATFRDAVSGKFTGGDATILYDSNRDGTLDTVLNFTAGHASIAHPDGRRDDIPTAFANPMLERIHELATAGRMTLQDTETLFAVTQTVVREAGFTPARVAGPVFATDYVGRDIHGQFSHGAARLQIDLDGDGRKDAAITARIMPGETFVKVTMADGRQGEITSKDLAQSLILTTHEARLNDTFEPGEISAIQALAQRAVREAGLEKLPRLHMAEAGPAGIGQLSSQGGKSSAGEILR